MAGRFVDMYKKQRIIFSIHKLFIEEAHMATEWLLEVSGEASQYVAEYLQAHGESPYETEMIDVRCIDGRKRDLYSIRGDFVRKLGKGIASFPHFSCRFWTRTGSDFEAYPADWLNKKQVSKNMKYVLRRIEEIEARLEAQSATANDDSDDYRRVS